MKKLASASLFLLIVLAFMPACKSGAANVLDPGKMLQPGQTLFSEGVSGGTPRAMPHAIAAFEKCTSCHYLGTKGAIHIVNEAHSCDECHVMSPMLPWDHGTHVDTTCVICHTEVKPQ